MIISINQPAYLPWLGYFDRIYRSDVHVILDHVQFEKNSFVNRNKIRIKEGSTILTVPLKTKGLFGSLAINTIETADNIWPIKHWKSIQSAYARAPYFKEHASHLQEFYSQSSSKLIDWILPMNSWFLEKFGINTKTVRSSDIQAGGSKGDLVLNICKSLNCTTYLSGPFGREYLDIDSFTKAGIKVIFHDYEHPVYSQVFPGFEPNMGAIDLLLNHGTSSLNHLARLNPIKDVIG